MYFYNSRWYDPVVGRFIQPDTIVPEPANPQALNRYTYTLNNPVRYTDPTGHWVYEEEPETPGLFYPPWEGEPGIKKVGYERFSDKEITFQEFIATATAPLWVPVLVFFGSATVAEGGAFLGGTRSVVTTAVQAASADGDPTNEVRTGANVVYQAVEDGITRYIGITNNFARRAGEQLAQRGINIEEIPGLSQLSRTDDRAVEQVLIEQHRLPDLLNKINSIATSNPIYSTAIERGKEILRIVGFE